MASLEGLDRWIGNVLLGLYIPFSLNSLSRKFLIHLVYEREVKQREYQKILGVDTFSYILGQLMTIYLEGFIFILILAISIYLSDFEQDLFGFLANLLFFMLSSINQCLALSTLFRQPKQASEIGSFIQIASIVLFYLIFFDLSNHSALEISLVSLFPQPAISIAILSSEAERILASRMLVIDSFLYLGLFLYLNAVIPDEYGVQQSPLLFLQHKRSQQPIAESLQEMDQIILLNPSEENEDLYIQRKERSCLSSIQLSHVTKIYHNQSTALNSLSLNLYPGEITCILGHNGAGKSTLINLLVGMVEKTRGKIRINGKILEENLAELREQIGVCFQSDVLYEEFTVRESLEFASNLKQGARQTLSKNQRRVEISQILETLRLAADQEKPVKNLSGGMRRKLSLGMSLVGASKIIILDEPSGSLDPLSRQEFWNTLLSVRSADRTILITTHQLDEAESLSDTVAILSRGELFALGSPEFIKQRFGQGYRISPSGRNTDIQQFQDLVEKHRLPEQRSVGFQKYWVLPQNAQLRDQVLREFQIFNLRVNLHSNSLEDVYINLSEHQLREQNSVQPRSRDQEIQQILALIAEKPATKRNFSAIKGIFLRQFYSFRRNWKMFLMFFLPLMFFYIGVIVIHELSRSYLRALEDGQMDQEVKERLGEMTRVMEFGVMGFFLVVGYSLNSSVYVFTPVLERQQNMYHLLRISGLGNVQYWVGTLLFDFLVLLLTVICFSLLVLSFQIDPVSLYLMELVLILSVFGLGLILFSYVMSFRFDSQNRAFQKFPLYCFFLFYTLPSIILELVPLQISKVCQMLVLLCSPFYSLQKSIEYLDAVNSSVLRMESRDVFQEARPYFFILILQVPLFASLLFYLDRKILLDSGSEKSRSPSGPADYQQISHSSQQSASQNLRSDSLQLNQVQIQGSGGSPDLPHQTIRSGGQEETAQPDSPKPTVHQLAVPGGQEEDRLSSRLVSISIDRSSLEQKRSLLSQSLGDRQSQQQVHYSRANGSLPQLSNIPPQVGEKQPLQALNLSKKYRYTSVSALSGVTLSVGNNSTLGLLGHNGSGKSTLLKIFSQELQKSDGKIQILGHRVGHKYNGRHYEFFGVCQQEDILWEQLTPKEHLSLISLIRGLRPLNQDALCDQILDFFELSEHRDRYSYQLSGGNRRKLCLAIALIANPSIALFDEISNGLDPLIRKKIWELIKAIQLNNKSSIILASHNLKEVEYLSDEIAIFNQGKFVYHSSIEALRDRFDFDIVISLEKVQDATAIQQLIQDFGTSFYSLGAKQNQVFIFIQNTPKFDWVRLLDQLAIYQQQNKIEFFSLQTPSLDHLLLKIY